LTLVAIHVLLPFGLHHKLTHILSQIRPQKSRFAFPMSELHILALTSKLDFPVRKRHQTCGPKHHALKVVEVLVAVADVLTTIGAKNIQLFQSQILLHFP
jgi:hypothetical protein